jgi:hypothetical protein
MEEGTKTKKTIFIGGIGDDVDESVIYENFSTFGMHPKDSSAPVADAFFLIQVISSRYKFLPLQPTQPNRQVRVVASLETGLIYLLVLDSRSQASRVCFCNVWFLSGCPRCHGQYGSERVKRQGDEGEPGQANEKPGAARW